MVPVGAIAIDLPAGETFTLVTSSWMTETEGNYTWVLLGDTEYGLASESGLITSFENGEITVDPGQQHHGHKGEDDARAAQDLFQRVDHEPVPVLSALAGTGSTSWPGST